MSRQSSRSFSTNKIRTLILVSILWFLMVLSLIVNDIESRSYIMIAIYAQATWMVRLRLTSGETLCQFRAVSRQTRRHSGRNRQCAVFYARIGSNFQAGTTSPARALAAPPLCDVTASKLEYADDVGLLDWTAAVASARVSALASGSRTSASLDMSAHKLKGMHVPVREAPLRFTYESLTGAFSTTPRAERALVIGWQE